MSGPEVVGTDLIAVDEDRLVGAQSATASHAPPSARRNASAAGVPRSSSAAYRPIAAEKSSASAGSWPSVVGSRSSVTWVAGRPAGPPPPGPGQATRGGPGEGGG